MTCDQIRWLLSMNPEAGDEALDLPVRRHLGQCPTCRAFRQALLWVESDLRARPLARPAAGLVPAVMGHVERCEQPREIAPPFTRAFCLISAMITLCALATGALLLQSGPVTSLRGSDSFLASTWLNPVWPQDASIWLSAQGGRQAAQFILAALAGIFVTVSSVLIGFRASHGR